MPEEPEMVFTSPLAGMFNSLIPHVTAILYSKQDLLIRCIDPY